MPTIEVSTIDLIMTALIALAFVSSFFVVRTLYANRLVERLIFGCGAGCCFIAAVILISAIAR